MGGIFKGFWQNNSADIINIVAKNRQSMSNRQIDGVIIFENNPSFETRSINAAYLFVRPMCLFSYPGDKFVIVGQSFYNW